MLGLTFSSKLDQVSYIISIAKIASKKIQTLICSMKFLSPEAAFYDTPMHGILLSCLFWWELLDKLQKRICRTVCPLEPLAYHRNVSSLCLLYQYHFGKWLSELTQLVPLPYFLGRPTCYSDRSRDFSVTIPRCYKDLYVNSFFPCTAGLWNSVPMQCFLLTCDLNGFKSRINRNLLTVGFFFRNSLYALIFLCFFFL